MVGEETCEIEKRAGGDTQALIDWNSLNVGVVGVWFAVDEKKRLVNIPLCEQRLEYRLWLNRNSHRRASVKGWNHPKI